jgi:hypothetical protein
MKRKLTPSERILVLEHAKRLLKSYKVDFICEAISISISTLLDINPYSFGECLEFYVPELLHYRPIYKNRNKIKKIRVGFGSRETTIWFDMTDKSRMERLRIIDMTINRIKSRSKHENK